MRLLFPVSLYPLILLLPVLIWLAFFPPNIVVSGFCDAFPYRTEPGFLIIMETFPGKQTGGPEGNTEEGELMMSRMPVTVWNKVP